MPDVLVVDDSLTVRMDLQEAFEEAGYRAFTCATAAAARAAVGRSTPDLMVLDLVLPDGDGAQLLREFRGAAALCDVPAIMLCTETEFRERAGAHGPRPQAFIGKPYDRTALLARAQAVREQRDGPSDDCTSHDGYRILAVDDSPTYLHALADQLQREGHTVLLAESGAAAIDLLERESVDCVLLDLVMSGMGGDETCRRIKSRVDWRSTPVVMLTAREDRQAILGSFEAGADDYIGKSADFAVLKARLSAQLRRRHAEDDAQRMREQLYQKEIEAAEARANRELAEMRAAHLADLERKNAELRAKQHELQRAKEAAEAASRQKDHFMAILSHELRTPLTPVIGKLSLLRRDSSLSPEHKAALEMIRRNVELETRLIDDLLDMTRIARGVLQLDTRVVDVHEKVRDALEIYANEIKAHGMEVSVSLEASRHHVEGDPARLQQVFWNLVGNALKYTPDGGRIAVRSRDDDGQIIVEVQDSGIGIEPELMARIFSPFEQGEQTLTRRYGGLGLGLSITRTLVELHGGSLTAFSEGHGKGSRFAVRLKTTTPAEAPKAPAHQPRTELPAADMRLLVVDDHLDTLRVMAQILKLDGYTVATATSIKDAVAQVKKDSFDLIISDIGLPDGTGWELMRTVREKQPMRGIALSGYATQEDVQRSKDAGFDAHLAKPVDPVKLSEVVRGVLRE